MITLDAVGKNYSGAWVLRDASFSVSRGELVALVGENGAGKSTLKNILCGLVAPDVGSLIVEGKDYSRLTHTAPARSGSRRFIRNSVSSPTCRSRKTCIWALVDCRCVLGSSTGPPWPKKRCAFSVIFSTPRSIPICP